MVEKGISVDDSQVTPDSDASLDVAGCTESETGVGRVPAKGPAKKRTSGKAVEDFIGERLFIYFIQCSGPLRPIKIGYARNPETRLSNLQSGCPYPLRLIGHAPIPDAPRIEEQLHNRFRLVSLRGEWHAETSAILALAQRTDEYRAARFHALIDGGTATLPAELEVDPRHLDEGVPIEPIPPSIASEVQKLRDSERQAKLDRMEKADREWDAAYPERKIEKDLFDAESARQEEMRPPHLKPGQFMWRGKVRSP